MQSSISGYRKQALNQAGPEVLSRGSVVSPILHLMDGDVSSFLAYFTAVAIMMTSILAKKIPS